MIRTPIYTALLSQLQKLTSAPYSLTIPTIYLGLEHAADLPPAQQPAIFLAPKVERSIYNRGHPIKWEIECEIYVYTINTGGDGNADGIVQLLPILDGIDAVLSPQTNQRGPGSYTNDLGQPDKIYHCAIKGNTEIFGGYLDEQTIARIPIEIVTAG